MRSKSSYIHPIPSIYGAPGVISALQLRVSLRETRLSGEVYGYKKIGCDRLSNCDTQTKHSDLAEERVLWAAKQRDRSKGLG